MSVSRIRKPTPAASAASTRCLMALAYFTPTSWQARPRLVDLHRRQRPHTQLSPVRAALINEHHLLEAAGYSKVRFTIPGFAARVRTGATDGRLEERWRPSP